MNKDGWIYMRRGLAFFSVGIHSFWKGGLIVFGGSLGVNVH